MAPAYQQMQEMAVDTTLVVERAEDFEPETKTRSRVTRAAFALVAACALAGVVAFASPATSTPASTASASRCRPTGG